MRFEDKAEFQAFGRMATREGLESWRRDMNAGGAEGAEAFRVVLAERATPGFRVCLKRGSK
jgi:hypothetical protein